VDPDTKLFFVGNKCDLESLRQVEYAAAKELIAKIGVPFMETSAKDGTRINEIFDKLSLDVAKGATAPKAASPDSVKTATDVEIDKSWSTPLKQIEEVKNYIKL
jgi:GTPase SAR1 family protein